VILEHGYCYIPRTRAIWPSSAHPEILSRPPTVFFAPESVNLSDMSILAEGVWETNGEHDL
jgi:hypothetical protein